MKIDRSNCRPSVSTSTTVQEHAGSDEEKVEMLIEIAIFTAEAQVSTATFNAVALYDEAQKLCPEVEIETIAIEAAEAPHYKPSLVRMQNIWKKRQCYRKRSIYFKLIMPRKSGN